MSISDRTLTLSECIENWRHLEGETVSIQATDPETGKKQNVKKPAWLFRGESAVYPTTFSSYHRFSLGKLEPNVKGQIERIVKHLDAYLCRSGFEPIYSAALLQHYGLPTEFLDLTCSLDVAAAFAAHGNDGKSNGLLMAFPISELAKISTVVELKSLHFARRPRLQKAFCWFHRTEPNLKKIMESVNVGRVEFQGTPSDIDYWEKHYSEICGEPHSDATSGLLNKIVSDIVIPELKKKDKMVPLPAALAWIEERIPWAPIPMRFADDGDELEPAWDKF